MTGEAAIRKRLADLIEADNPEDIAFVDRMVRSFVARAPGLSSDVLTALRDGDAPATAHRAHTLKGAASNVGAVGIARLSAELEAAAGAADLERVRDLPALLDAELSVAIRQLLDVLADLG